jgi:RNA polymerase sigma-32 factor
MHALQKFDRSKNNRFSTYAVLWVRAFIQDFILKSWSLVKVGSSNLRKQLLFNLRGIKKVLRISSNTDNNEKNKKLAQHFNISETEIGEITSSLNNRDISLETPVSDNENVSLGDTISRDSGDYDNILAVEEERKYRMKIFRESLSVLDERQREILVARYLEEKKATLDELSKRFNISKERVRQIEESAIKKLKQFAENYDK